ncbi:hypothetical protein KR084_005410, partial [Drosophila pseudotakahashii]
SHEYIYDNDDLPHEYIYDNDDPYVPDKPVFADLKAVDAENITISRTIPPYPHSSRLINGKRTYIYKKTKQNTHKSKMWRQAYKILDLSSGLHVVRDLKSKGSVNTVLHPCLHRIQGHIDPDADTKCPRCRKPISASFV